MFAVISTRRARAVSQVETFVLNNLENGKPKILHQITYPHPLEVDVCFQLRSRLKRRGYAVSGIVSTPSQTTITVWR